MEGFPDALVLASQEEVYRDNNVLFRLVRPTPDGFGVQSTDRLVNVVPFRRVYCFERKNEIDIFRQELLKRPIVLQPILHFGRGLFPNCGMCYTDESWVVMINQTHPKILSRLQMGFDYAKAGIERGQSVEIKFCFGDLIERVYKEHLAQKEHGEAKSGIDSCLARMRYAEWEYGDLKIRYHGYAARLGRSAGLKELKTMSLNWHFDDIGMHEMKWSQLAEIEPCKPNLAPVTEDEIRATLHAWTINSVSPLEAIGDSIPDNTYSYKQAGRLYESFRKKKRQRDQQRNGDRETSQFGTTSAQNPDECIGAVGGEPVGVEHDFSQYSRENSHPTNSRRKYHDQHIQYEDYSDGGINMQFSDSYQKDEIDNAYHKQNSLHSQTSGMPVDKYGHHYANVQITGPSGQDSSGNKPSVSPDFPSSSLQNQLDSSHYNHYTNVSYIRKQDSDRSSRSTNADSGYCAGSDGQRSRGGSYDMNDYSNKVRLDNYGNFGNDTTPLEDISGSPSGLVNSGFCDFDNETDLAMQKHKEMVQNMLQEGSSSLDKYTSKNSHNHYLQPHGLHSDLSYSKNPEVKMTTPHMNMIGQAVGEREHVADTFI